jgi:hypothetical protein
MLCPGCGGENEEDHQFCIHCGASLQSVPSAQKPPQKRIPVTQAPAHDGQQEITIISVAAIIVSFIVIFILTGRNLKTIPALLLLFAPIILGELIFSLRLQRPILMVRKFQDWVIGNKEINAHRGGFVRKWILEPLALCLAKTMQGAEGIENPHLRAGLIICVFLYTIGFVVYVAIGIVVAIVSH